jgi:hypothetical protein
MVPLDFYLFFNPLCSTIHERRWCNPNNRFKLSFSMKFGAKIRFKQDNYFLFMVGRQRIYGVSYITHRNYAKFL